LNLCLQQHSGIHYSISEAINSDVLKVSV
jgi:hypothetical protein